VRLRPDARFVLVPALALALPILLVGCGYQFVRYQNTGGEAQQIAVVTLQNDSQEAGVELLVSEALRHEILQRGGLELVSDPEAADFRLRGRVLPVRTRSRSFTGSVLAREYELTLRLDLRVDSKSTDTHSMEREQFTASEIYLASADSAVLRKNRQEALRYLSGLLARRVHDSIDRKVLGVL
jgi:outer membrane lipopolysaccharide assembly protein LptE/RlpB